MTVALERLVGRGWHKHANRVCLGCANSGRAQIGPASDGYSHIWCNATAVFARYARADGGACGRLAKLFEQRPEQLTLLTPNAQVQAAPRSGVEPGTQG